MKDYKQYHKFFDLVSEWIGNERSLNAKLDLMEETRHVAKRLRKRNYGLYLQSEEWREKREHVLRRDKRECQLCGELARHVHHLTYERIYNEPLYDLVSLCASCHDMIHLLDKD